MSIETSLPAINYGQAAELDPLQLDTELARLPIYNQSADVAQLGSVLCKAADCVVEFGLWSTPEESLAAMRDLDFLASSLVAHGVNPTELAPSVEPAFSRLGNDLQTIPRGTVYTYTSANPSQPRRRSFTGNPQEELFVQAVTDATNAMDAAVESFAHNGPLAGVAGFDVAAKTLLDRVISVKRNVTPQFFTGELRPYLDPLTIEGVEYFGPGGVQQSLAMDYLLWGYGDSDPTYREFVLDNLKYLSPQQRQLTEKSIKDLGNMSVLSHLEQNPDEELATMVHGVLRTLRKFRYPHKRLADDNAALALEADTYASAILPVLITKTESKISLLEAQYGFARSA